MKVVRFAPPSPLPAQTVPDPGPGLGYSRQPRRLLPGQLSSFLIRQIFGFPHRFKLLSPDSRASFDENNID